MCSYLLALINIYAERLDAGARARRAASAARGDARAHHAPPVRRARLNDTDWPSGPGPSGRHRLGVLPIAFRRLHCQPHCAHPAGRSTEQQRRRASEWIECSSHALELDAGITSARAHRVEQVREQWPLHPDAHAARAFAHRSRTRPTGRRSRLQSSETSKGQGAQRVGISRQTRAQGP